MHRIRLRVLAVSFLAVSASASLPAFAQQDGSPRTYTVKRGDTLWDIAKALLGDAYLWPEIYRLNTGTIEDPHWIYPGAVLRLPGAGQALAPATERTVTPAAPARREGLRQTVFSPQATAQVRAQKESFVVGARSTAVRAGEYEASPFMWSVGGPRDAGLVELTAESQGIAMTLANRPLQLREPVFVRIPKGMRGETGQRLLVFRLGEVVNGQGQVVIPTGTLRLISAAKNGIAEASVMRQFEDVHTGQGVIGLDSLNLPLNTFPKRVESGLATTVSWLHSQPVLPTTGHYIILSAGAKDGLTPGDQLSLRREHASEPGGAIRAEEEVGVAQITRVTPWGASAMIIMQQQAGIVGGMRATVTAKMP